MESALESYRRKKRVETLKTNIKERVTGFFRTSWDSVTGYLTNAVLPEIHQPTSTDTSDTNTTEDRDEADAGDDEDVNPEETAVTPARTISKVEVILKVVLWILLYIGFLKIGFGAIFFILSSFWLIWTNLRSGPRKPNEPSAYSVFNPNCEALDGQLTAEKLEKQLLFQN